MIQHPIDLLPDDLRERSRAGVRTGRCIANTVLAIIILIVATTYMRISLQRTAAVRDATHTRADLVLATEARAAELRATLSAAQREIDHYRRIAIPLEISSVMATVVNQLPESMTLESMTLDAAPRRETRNNRGRSALDAIAQQTRTLNGEIGGFAATDEQITSLVDLLSSLTPFRAVNLDFTRSRMVRDYSAREFRISFQIDLDQRYDVEIAPVALAGEKGAP